MDSFKGLTVPSHLRPPAAAVNWIELTGDSEVDARMKAQLTTAIDLIRDVLANLAAKIHANGLEKCVGCSLCAAACPSDCIRVVADENTPDNRVSAGERYARIYEINLSRCIFCGYCELACPFDAITLGNEYEISEYSRDDLIYTKDMLLGRPVKKIPVADPSIYDTPVPYYKTHS